MALSATRTAPSCTPRSRTASRLCSSAAAAARCTPASSVVRTTGEVPSRRCATCGASERGDGIAGTPASARRAAACMASAAIRSGTRVRSAVTRRTMAAGAAPGAATSAASTALSAGVRASGVVPNSAAAAAPTPASSPRKSTRFRYASRIWSFDHARSSAQGEARIWAHFWASVRGTPARSQARIDQRRHLHRDRARAARRSTAQGLDERRRQRTRVDAGVLGEAAILDGDDRACAATARSRAAEPSRHGVAWRRCGGCRARRRGDRGAARPRIRAQRARPRRVERRDGSPTSPSTAASVTPPQASAACRRVIGPRRARSASRRTAPARRAPRPGSGAARRCRAGSAGWRTSTTKRPLGT